MTKERMDSLIVAMILTLITVGIWLAHRFEGQSWFGLAFTGGAAIFWMKGIFDI